MKALIDADIIPYEFGGMVQLENPDEPLPFEIVRKMVDDRIEYILDQTNADAYELFLTDSKSNFRNDVATILPYKGHRKTEKAYHWEAIRQHLIDNYGAEVQYGIEADDRLGQEQYRDYLTSGSRGSADGDELWYECQTIICSRDKDLKMIPGWHYVWPAGNQKESKFFQNETDAIRCFYSQLLTGDSTDNILGLFGVGAKSSLVRAIQEMDEEQLMFQHVLEAYEKRFGTYATQFMYENAQLLWIGRSLDTSPDVEIVDRLNALLWSAAGPAVDVLESDDG